MYSLSEDEAEIDIYIMLTCPCNVAPLTPHFHIAKLGFYRGIHCFLIFAQNIDCGYMLEPHHYFSNVYPQFMF